MGSEMCIRDRVRVPGSIVSISQGKQKVKIHAEQSEELFNQVMIRATDIKMRVNQKKTQLLCVSASNTSEISSYIRCGDGKIESTNELKMLGFIFGSTPSVRPHVNYMVKKANKKLWILRHLRRAGLEEEDLLRAYNTLVRPTVEYAVPTYHPMLNQSMRDEIEGIQKRACRVIFGWDCDYDVLVDSGRVEALDSRREKLTMNFARKAEKNPRFEHWFEKSVPERTLRKQSTYVEKFARTERLRNSPLYYMRRAMNNDANQ